MFRPSGVARQIDDRFDEAGFEVPFAGTFEGDAIPPRARCQELPTGKDKVSCSNQPQTIAKLCAPGANLTCPSIPELWVSSTIEGVPFYYGAVVRTVEGTGGKRKALVRVETKSYQVRLTPIAWRAAQRWITSMSTFGMPIAAVITAGAGPYCRCIKSPKGICRHDNPGGCTGKKLSNHGAGDAIDITGVMWKDHQSVGSQLRVTLMHSWSDAADQAPLLVRINAALRLSFATVIDYTDPGHRDHFHVDTNNGAARSVFGMEAERWFLAGCLRSLGFIERHAKPPTWADVQPGLAAFARQANIAVPAAAGDKNAWREIVAGLYGRVALGRPDAGIREITRAETLVADERFDEAETDADSEAESAYENESESYDESESEDEAEAALSESEGDERDVALGTLRHTSKNGKTFTYKFTEEDLVWTARYLMGEAGDDVERTAVLWTMVNRFAFYRALGRGWRTFAALLRAYSSPLQYPLNSVGAAYRHWKNCPGAKCRFVDLSAEFGYYKKTMNGQRVPKGQLRPFIAIQKTGWNSLNEGVRRVAANVLSGAAPNNVGLATEFADTAVFWRDHHRGVKGPTRTQWLEYTKTYAAQKKYIWVSDTAPYDQYRRNVLFIQAKFRDETLPAIVASQASQSATTQPELETSYADTHHARGARDAFEYEDESDRLQGEGFDSPEHVLLGTPAAETLGAPAPSGIQKLVDGWARRGLIDGGAFIDTGAMRFLTIEKPASPISEWKILVPRAVSGGAATAPYAGQSIPPPARWHWIAPDPVFRRPGERWTAGSLRGALLAGDAVALNLGQIIMLAGDLVATFAALKKPGVRKPVEEVPRSGLGSMVGFHESDPYTLAVYSQLSPKPHHAGITGVIDDLGSLNALREPKGLQDRGRAFGLGNALYEKEQRRLQGSDPPDWVKDLRMWGRLLRAAGGPTGFSELHLLGQMMSVNQIRGFQIAANSPWLNWPERVLLESSETRDVLGMSLAPEGFDDRFFQELVTNGRFFHLAERNDTHFSPAPGNWQEFEKEFRAAMVGVHDHIASRRSPHPIPADSVAQLAYALHFLTDAFSSGHMRVPRRVLGRSMKAKLMHDIDGALGLNVFNAFGRWRAFGDGKLKDPGDLGKKILTTLRDSGIDASPDASLRFAREAVGAAFKQLHYHAQHFTSRNGTEHIRPVLDANRGSARDGLVGDDAAAGCPGDGDNKDAWINSHLDQRLQYLKKHQPQVYPVGRNWDTRRENHAPLYDLKGNLFGAGLYWDSGITSLYNARIIKIRLPASGTEQTVKDYTKIYQLALNTPEGLPWLPRDPEFLQVFDELPDASTLWGVARAAAAAGLPNTTSDAAVDRERETVGEAAPIAEMESRSRAAKLELFPAWRKLLLMKVDDGIQKALAKRKMRVQYAHNESYSNDLNFDLYPVRINRFPTSGGKVMTPEEFLTHVRLNLNSFLDTSISKFYPYSLAEAALWAFDNPVGIVLKIDIVPDNAAVVVSSATPMGWVFSTVTTPATGTHPVSGHRSFFLAQRDGTYYFINKGLDMTSSGIAGLGLPIAGWFGYRKADELWRSLQNKLTKFINANGGEAKKETRISERVEWRYVYHRNRQALERVFGKGAGSSRNSPFFEVIDESMETTSDQSAV